ncbi:MAG: hypothetical protein HON90_12155 [Halobacteriovoraceae bacterium]|jgi:predicted choloylglycine hydrolase|nr:hypothetical protein [Halobacteriovoraceae bacterium]
MSIYSKKFICIEEDFPAKKWLDFYNGVSSGYHKWYFQEGNIQKPSLDECRTALEQYMPKFVSLWEHLRNLTSAEDEMARMLSLYCPTPYKRGCTQAAWTRYSPVLVRNYDYSPSLFEGRILKSKWFDTNVIATTDCLWGALDGINEHGLCISLAYGGSDIIGKGFGITLVVRYILEFCKSSAEAIELLKKIPINMAYNITVMDKYYHVSTIELSPFDEPKVTACPFAVNQQGGFDLNNYSIFSNSSDRKQSISELLFDPLVSIESFIAAFGYAPLYSTDYENSFGTLYTAIYNPFLRASEYRWPGDVRLYQSFEHFIEQEVNIVY